MITTSDTLVIYGTTYSGVEGVKATDSDSNTKTYIRPTGTKSISTNGTHDVTDYASASVNVSGGVSVDDIATNTAPNGAVTLGSSVTEIGKYAFAGKPITSISSDYVTKINEYAFNYCASLTSVSFPNVTNLTGMRVFADCNLTDSVYFPELTTMTSSYVFSGNSNLNIGVFPKLTSTNQSLRSSQFQILDFSSTISIGNYWFSQCSRFNTLILRSTTLCPLTNIGGFSGTCFDSGKTGGTIYIPKVLYDHLGDNSAYDYKHASNWSTLDGYGTVTWAKIEGSAYETHYADGTVIPT